MSEIYQTPPAPRKAATFLNYKGDRTREAIGQVMGPNTMGELLLVVEATYDPATDRTRMGLAYGPRVPGL